MASDLFIRVSDEMIEMKKKIKRKKIHYNTVPVKIWMYYIPLRTQKLILHN